MKPIWYFVGLILLAMGGIIFLAGVYLFINPSQTKTVLYETYPNIWWGLIMMLFGLFMFLKTRKEIID